MKNQSFNTHQRERIEHWNEIAVQSDHWKGLGGYYHHRINQVYQFWIPLGSKVLEIGCGQGELLASLRPEIGVGLDFSEEMLKRARVKYPHLSFYESDAHDLKIEETDFDYIVLSDLINDLWDVQIVLQELNRLCNEGTRIILNTYSRLWEPPLAIAEKLGYAKPVLHRNWLTIEDINNLFTLSGFESIRFWQEIIFPIYIPIITSFHNRFLVRFWPFKELALSNFIIASKRPETEPFDHPPSISVVIPARNESENINNLFETLPNFHCDFELIFVEGHSNDNTIYEIEKNIQQYAALQCKLIQQTGIGKGNAVREGFKHASGDILMILDADLTVPFDYLPRFYEAISTGKGKFINGVRLVYPIEKHSMQFFNLIGNKFFCYVFSWILGQPIKDTLCGTKVLWRSDYLRIAENRPYFGNFDPFGDFDLLLGASKLNLRIVDMPIRYQKRTYGTTNIKRWEHGRLLLKMAFFAVRKLKFQ